MSFVGRPSIVAAAVVTCATGGFIAGASAQDSKSAAIAKELAQMLDAAKLEAIAAPDPATPGVFVAAMYIPGSELLVVSAKYAAPPLLVDRITARTISRCTWTSSRRPSAGARSSSRTRGPMVSSQNRPAINLQTAGTRGTSRSTFDGDWKKAKIAEADTRRSYTAADDRYAKMLSMLLAQAKKAKAGS